jgi:small subunit ribosomal protein S18
MNTVNFVDYKNTKYLKQFLNPHGRMNGQRKTNVSAKHQRAVQNAIKRARFMGLLPYVIK